MANRTQKTIELRDNQLIFRFPEVHGYAELAIEFQRTLRIPDDNREYFLPPGLGRFPLSRVDDYPDNLPETWSKHGGVFTPMYQAEAMWICFHGDYPMAVKIAAGKVNAVTGETWEEEAQRGTAGLHGGAGSTVAGRVLRGEGLDSAVRGDAAGRGLHGGRAVNRRGGAWGASDCGLPHEAVEIRRNTSRSL